MQVVPNPDPILSAAAEAVVATADAQILDRCPRWLALAREVIRSRVPAAHVVDLCV